MPSIYSGHDGMTIGKGKRSHDSNQLASARKKTPVTPVIAISGRNTTMGVIVEPIKGAVTSPKALCMASTRACPAS